MLWQVAVQAAPGGSQPSPGSTTPLPQPLSQMKPAADAGDTGRRPVAGQPQGASAKPAPLTWGQSPSLLEARKPTQRGLPPANDRSSVSSAGESALASV